MVEPHFLPNQRRSQAQPSKQSRCTACIMTYGNLYNNLWLDSAVAHETELQPALGFLEMSYDRVGATANHISLTYWTRANHRAWRPNSKAILPDATKRLLSQNLAKLNLWETACDTNFKLMEFQCGSGISGCAARIRLCARVHRLKDSRLQFFRETD
ncbi:uncharacterized protein CCOS01_00332 [Colletotrichum costaricense]|uniref:Uncharacterized protein n=1 Tax=Colletotrichum costaricense TaxID=1209916 RepID=A0AAI9Z9B1_9PEZI|nr:uncharacterized protein CCOS01_00332 [Colletotrichum costaricense]KAK1539018.1 hypothetical protein CCOS01_00332 [Colletotrichum costaricense]